MARAEENQLVDAVARRTSLSRYAALRVTKAVLQSLAERLTLDEAMSLAGGLNAALAEVVTASGSRAERFDLNELVRRVQERTGTSRDVALQNVAVVCMAVVEHVRAETLAPVRRSLPPSIAFLLRPAPSFGSVQ